jgi:DNA-directed RNA polymerase specialized sigma24 family protein/CheY-like chemotaxis protein
MSLKADIGPQLPLLRRYARALTGSQSLGDAAVREMLEALLAAPHEFDSGRPTRLELYLVFHRLWHGLANGASGSGTVASLSLPTREALLLTAIEDFSIADTAEILGSSVAKVTAEIEAARAAIADSLESSVMIIEDEAIIALHLKSIVEDLGHEVAGIARTRSEAVAMAGRTQPELVLADISLADGSSGIDAVKDILAMIDLPVIFITAFPERLLTGERPEPTYLITKPFSPETVTATIGQALLFHREQASIAASPAAQELESAVPDPRKHFESPKALLADPELDDGAKQALLTEWDSEIDGQLNAEAEGMGISDPLSARKEAQLANEARQAKSALTKISQKLDPTR